MSQVVKSSEAGSQKQGEFYAEARKIVADQFQPNEFRYWLDFLVSTTLGYALASVFLAMPILSWGAGLSFFGASFALYRASMFVHEVVHLPKSSMKRFRFAWNLFAGVPMMVPSFAYNSHIHHHSSRHYGTEHDGEYLPLASGSVRGVLLFLAQIFFQPILVFLRFLVLTPLSFLNGSLRKWTIRHASSLVINFRYERDAAQKYTAADTFWEVLTWIRATTAIALVLTQVMPATRLPKMLLLAMFILTVNHLRTLAAHRYTNSGIKMSHTDQFLDSTNVTGNWLTELVCPLGLRYHALHHLFPGIPYHNLGTAHTKLTDELHPSSLYHESTIPNLRTAWRDLLAHIKQNRTTTSSLSVVDEMVTQSSKIHKETLAH